MPPPTLRQLMDFFWAPNHPPLPTEIEPAFRDRTVAGLPVCGSQDSTSLRLLGFPNDPNSAIWLTPGQITPTSTFLNPDSVFLRRVLTGTNGLEYQREEAGPNHTTVPGGTGTLDLCRDASPLAGTSGDTARYSVYVTDNAILNHINPGVPGMALIDIPLQPSEIIALVSRLPIPNEHYGVAPGDHTRLSILTELEADRMIAFVNRSDSPIAANRRGPIVDAINRLKNTEQMRMARDQGANQREGLDLQRSMRSEMRWQMIGMTVASILGGLYTGLAISGKAGPIHDAVSLPFRGLYNLLRMPFDHGEGWTRFWNEATTGLRYRGIPTLLRIGTNLSELARLGEIRPVADATTPAVAQRIEGTLNSKFNTMSVLVEGPPGWGKEVLMRELARRNPNSIYIQTTPNGMIGGTMYHGQYEERITNIQRELTRARKEGRQVILMIDEFHEALSAGKNMERTVSLLENFKGELARGDIRIVGFSTPREMLKARYIAGYYNDAAALARLSPDLQAEVAQFRHDGVKQNIELRALLERFLPEPLPARPASDIVSIVRDKITERNEANGLRIEMDDATIRRIAQLSESAMASEGHIPRKAMAIFNGVIDANMTNGSSTVTVTTDMVDGYVRSIFPDIAQRFNITGGTPPPTGGTPPPSGTRVVTDTPDPAPRDPSIRVVTSADDPAPRPVLRVVSDAPVAPPTAGTTVTSIFTEDSFYEMFRSRYPQFQNDAGQVHGNYQDAVRAMAREAFNRWQSDPNHPTVTVDGHVFPRENVIESVFRDTVNFYETRSADTASELRRIRDAGRERLGEGRDLDTTSESFRAEGLRAFEAIGR